MVADAPPARVVRHHSALGEWEIVSRAPAPRLRAHVLGYHGYVERTPGVARRIEAPSGRVVLIVGLGPPIRVIDPRDPAGASGTRHSFVAGLHNAYMLTESGGAQRGLEVTFTPIGAHLFLGLPMDALANRAVELDDLLGAAGRRLAARLREAPTWEARFTLLDAIIAARLADAPAPAAGVAWAWQRLNETGGCLGIGALAAEVGCSPRHLIAQFREQIGLPPKTVARVLRFQRAIRLLERDDGARWAAIAHDCGYCDQAHFIRDFRAFAGRPPGEFLGRRLPDGGGVIGD